MGLGARLDLVVGAAVATDVPLGPGLGLGLGLKLGLKLGLELVAADVRRPSAQAQHL